MCMCVEGKCNLRTSQQLKFYNGWQSKFYSGRQSKFYSGQQLKVEGGDSNRYLKNESNKKRNKKKKEIKFKLVLPFVKIQILFDYVPFKLRVGKE